MKTRKNFHKSFFTIKIYILLLLLYFVSAQSVIESTTYKKCYSFKEYVQKYGKKFETEQQYQKRQMIYNLNIQKIKLSENQVQCQGNFKLDMDEPYIQKNYSTKVGQQENTYSKLNGKHNNYNQKYISNLNLKKRLLTQSIPTSYDWRNHTNFTTVKNSGICGSSQAFATAAFFQQEIVTAGTSNQTIDLSEMYLMGCNPQNLGCKPGLVEPLLDFVLQKGGIPLESQYPFNPPSVPQKICFQQSLFSIPNVSRVSYYEVKDPEKIKQIIFKKPAIASVCGVDMVSYFPDSRNSSSRTLRCSPHNKMKDHHVLLVGYTETEWIVKNSWGPGWGIDGYGYISKDNAEDCCIGDEIHTTGVHTEACSVIYCKSCVDEKLCGACQTGRYVSYNSSTGIQTCEPCTQLNCNECYNYIGTCKWCADGFSIDQRTNRCSFSTIESCNKIQNGVCVQCKPGFKLSSDGLMCILSCKVQNCHHCAQGPCTTCKSGYNMLTPTVNGKQIQVCKLNTCSVTNCSLCDSSGQCIMCKNGYLLNSTTHQCESNCSITDCISCASLSTQCDICIDGKSWNKQTKICQAFLSTPNCKQFNVNCTSCKQGYLLKTIKQSPYKCVQLCQEQSCQQCLLNDISHCNTCKTGYTLNVTSYSSKCQKNLCNILNCSLCSSDGTQCVKCVNDFFVFNSTANQCENQCSVQNCKYCLPTDTICTTCNDGYAFNTDNSTCVTLNITNCVKVYFAGIGPLQQFCLQCRQNYTLLKTAYSFDKQCILECKATNCKRCKEQTPYVCQQCSDETYPKLVNGSLQCQYPRKQFKNCAFPSLNQSFCFACDEFYFKNPLTGLCQLNTQNCPITCEYCTPPGYSGGFSCKCKNGLFFNKVNKQCMSNPFNDSNCIAGSFSASFSYCGTCVQGMSVNYTSWKGCTAGCYVQNCKTCVHESYLLCQVCNQGYYLNDRLQCQLCTLNITNCQNCFLSKCVSCKIGYYLAPNRMECKPVQCNDKQIYDGLSCVCPPGTYYQNLTCSFCNQPHCLDCNMDSCFSCEKGFYLLNNQCLKCIQNCKLCDLSPTNCIDCLEGYFYDLNLQKCLNYLQNPRICNVSQVTVAVCPSNCIACTSEQKCTNCNTNYHQIAGTCHACLNNCKTCLRTNLAICSSCDIGYHMNFRKQCVKCLDQNCIDCTISQKACILCNRGYYPNNGTCKICLNQACKLCNYYGQCTQCSSGYTLMGDGTCQQCGGNCRSCNSSAINQCFTECNLTSYLSNNACFSCPSECKTCVSASVCLSCADGFNLRNSQCLKICLTGCYECDQSNIAKCLKCYNSYKLLQNETCIYDATCYKNNSCAYCPQKLVLINGVCYDCRTRSSCRRCSDKNLDFCLQCIDGFYINEGMCTVCNQSCLICTGADDCKLCKDGYFKPVNSFQGNCLRCDTMCKTCYQSAQKCTSCNEGYQLTVTDKCLSKTKIQGQIKLDLSLSDFPSSSKLIRKSILGCLGSSYQNQTKYYIITKLQEGSVILTFSVSIPEGLNSTTTFQTFRTNIAALSQLGGITVISTGSISLLNAPNTDPNNGNQPTSDNPIEQGDNTKKLAIILGVIIPVVVIVSILLACIIKRRLNNKKINIEQQMGMEEIKDEQKTCNPKFNQTIEFSTLSGKKKDSEAESGYYENNSVTSQQSNQRLKNLSAVNPSTVILVKKRNKSKRNSSAIDPSKKKHLNIVNNFTDDWMETHQKAV